MNKENYSQFILKQKVLNELSIISAVLIARESRYLSLEYIAKQAPHMAFKHVLRGGLEDDWWCEFWRNCGLLEAKSIQAVKNGTSD